MPVRRRSTVVDESDSDASYCDKLRSRPYSIRKPPARPKKTPNRNQKAKQKSIADVDSDSSLSPVTTPDSHTAQYCSTPPSTPASFDAHPPRQTPTPPRSRNATPAHSRKGVFMTNEKGRALPTLAQSPTGIQLYSDFVKSQGIIPAELNIGDKTVIGLIIGHLWQALTEEEREHWCAAARGSSATSHGSDFAPPVIAPNLKAHDDALIIARNLISLNMHRGNNGHACDAIAMIRYALESAYQARLARFDAIRLRTDVDKVRKAPVHRAMSAPAHVKGSSCPVPSPTAVLPEICLSKPFLQRCSPVYHSTNAFPSPYTWSSPAPPPTYNHAPLAPTKSIYEAFNFAATSRSSPYLAPDPTRYAAFELEGPLTTHPASPTPSYASFDFDPVEAERPLLDYTFPSPVSSSNGEAKQAPYNDGNDEDVFAFLAAIDPSYDLSFSSPTSDISPSSFLPPALC